MPQAQLHNRGWPWLAVLPSRPSNRRLLIILTVSLFCVFSLVPQFLLFDGMADLMFHAVAQKEWSIFERNMEMIKQILRALFGLNTKVTQPVHLWIDENDEAFQELVCYIDDDGSRIWRAVEKHSSLHAGLNVLNSMNDIINQNLVVLLIEIILTNLIQDIYDQYSAYITSTGHIIQAWTQAWRLCTTKWDYDSLETREEKPDEDDEDDWLPRYEIFTKPDSSIASLRSMERVLASEGWEASYDGQVFKSYVVDLNIMQALLPKTMSFVDETFRFVWKGPGNDSKSTAPVLPSEFELAPFDLEQFSSGNSSTNRSAPASSEHLLRAFEPNTWPAPTGSLRAQKPPGDHFKSLSQQKGQDLRNFNYYTYAKPRGEGSWIFIIDSGFDTSHPVSLLGQQPLAHWSIY
jgi:hypothetical protein